MIEHHDRLDVGRDPAMPATEMVSVPPGSRVLALALRGRAGHPKRVPALVSQIRTGAASALNSTAGAPGSRVVAPVVGCRWRGPGPPSSPGCVLCCAPFRPSPCSRPLCGRRYQATPKDSADHEHGSQTYGLARSRWLRQKSTRHSTIPALIVRFSVHLVVLRWIQVKDDISRKSVAD
jgi:hypothetical protein